MPVPQRQTCHLPDLTLSYVERHPELRGKGPTLLFVHATGFHARIWDQVIADLPPRHSICLDQRGHGQSGGGQSEGGKISGWAMLCDDLARFLDQMDLQDMIGIGHSLGGHVTLSAAATLPGRFRQLVLIDPVILPPPFYQQADTVFPPGSSHPAARRQRLFASPQEMQDRFRNRMPYALFAPKVLQDYCTHALRPSEDGAEHELCCHPETEASVYVHSLSNPGIFEAAKAADLPVHVIRAKPPTDWAALDFTASPTWPGLAEMLPRGRETYLPEMSHFVPMQAPQNIAAMIRSELAGVE